MSFNTAKAVAVMRGLTQKFDQSVQASKPFFPRVSTVVKSKGADEAYGMLGAMPGMREWLGERKFKQLRGATFTIDNRHWESSLLVEKNDISDDRLGMYGPLMSDLGTEATYHPDELFFEALVNGETEACFDGQNFFDTDHVFGDSGTLSNDLTSAIVDASDPTADEFKDAFHSARSTMLKYKNDQGKLLNRPTGTGLKNLLLVCNPDFEVVAKKALTASIGSDGADNIVVDAPQILSTAYLTDSTKFYLFNLDGALKPFVFQDREPLTRQVKGINDSETKDVKFMTEARYAIGYFAWWKSCVHTFTTA